MKLTLKEARQLLADWIMSGELESLSDDLYRCDTLHEVTSSLQCSLDYVARFENACKCKTVKEMVKSLQESESVEDIAIMLNVDEKEIQKLLE